MEMDRSDQDNTGSASLEEILWQLAYQCWQTQFATELDMAVALFEGDIAAARKWLQMPQRGLGGETPLDFASTEVGAREVENLIGRLEHGVFI